MKLWECKIGEADSRELPDGADRVMRDAVRDAYYTLTGRDPDYIFSGWAGELTAGERAAARVTMSHEKQEFAPPRQ